MSEKRITRRMASNRQRGATEWERLDGMTEEEIEANAASDSDNGLWTEEQLADARLVMSDVNEQRKAMRDSNDAEDPEQESRTTPVPPSPSTDDSRLALLQQARGMWRDRDDLPSFAELRRELDRNFSDLAD